MSVHIRLTRMGAKKRPFYRIVAIDSRLPRDGRPIEVLGYYDPQIGVAKAEVKEDRVRHWLGCGARPSEVVSRILRRVMTQSKAA